MMVTAGFENVIAPCWPAPQTVRAFSTTRRRGHSKGAYHSFNLGAHVGDDPQAVAKNRAALRELLELPSEPLWLRQVHGCRVMEADGYAPDEPADASIARRPGAVCAVLTADCLPVLFCDRGGANVAVAHAGWRGLAAGVLEVTLATMGTAPRQILAWIGPGIGRDRFEVGEEVRDVFVGGDHGAHELFRPSPGGRWLADLAGLARRRLHAAGVAAVFGGSWCTYTEEQRFFSYRREPQTGRMTSLIWIEPESSNGARPDASISCSDSRYR